MFQGCTTIILIIFLFTILGGIGTALTNAGNSAVGQTLQALVILGFVIFIWRRVSTYLAQKRASRERQRVLRDLLLQYGTETQKERVINKLIDIEMEGKPLLHARVFAPLYKAGLTEEAPQNVRDMFQTPKSSITDGDYELQKQIEALLPGSKCTIVAISRTVEKLALNYSQRQNEHLNGVKVTVKYQNIDVVATFVKSGQEG